MRFLYFVGTAGSGKSTLVQAYKEWLDSADISSIIVNLDPGSDATPYEPDIDIRDWISLGNVMEPSTTAVKVSLPTNPSTSYPELL
ncbi:MAG: ATP/GTP-binding protein [Candidatus Methanomethylophilus sp.]|nr:ATP/GTP-binding protein [Methanomethylophilus sp.]